MILALLLAALAFVTVLVVLTPLLRGGRPNPDRASYDQAVYRDQLRELDRDIARGLITSDEAASARLEIQRRILATTRPVVHSTARRSLAADPQAGLPHAGIPQAGIPQAGIPQAGVPQAGMAPADAVLHDVPQTMPPRPTTASIVTPARLSRSPALAGVLFVAIALGSVGLYLRLGAPEVPDEPFAARQAEIAATRGGDRPSLEQAVNQLAARLKANPTNPRDWLLYAHSLEMLSRWAGAEDAFRHAMALGENSPEVAADHAETMVLAADGMVTPAAEAAFRQILAADPGSGIARYYLAIAASQGGEPRKAIDMLQGLLAAMPADSPLRGPIGQRIAEAAEAAHTPVPELAQGTTPAAGPDANAGTSAAVGPDANAVASATNLTDEQRQAMIQGMVARLAAKQQADPVNLQGWLQLARAYTVLHQPDKAADAFEKAANLKPDDASIPLQEVRALLAERKPTDRLPVRVVDLLRRVQAMDPQEPITLWFLGIAAAQDRHPDEARRYWGALLAKLPPNGEDANMIQKALDTLPPAEPAAGTPPNGALQTKMPPNGGPQAGASPTGASPSGAR